MKWFWKLFWWSLGLGSVLAGLAGSALFLIGWLGSGKILAKPEQGAIDEWQRDFYEHPQEFAVEIEKFEVIGCGGVRLRACLFEPLLTSEPSARGRRLKKAIIERAKVDARPILTPRGTIVLLHGYGESKEQTFRLVERLVALGFRCLTYDSRAHGKSGGEQVSFGFHEAKDALKVIAHAREQVGPLGPLGILGVSMGGGIALQAMGEGEDFACGVAISPFATMSERVWEFAEGKFGHWSLALVPVTDVVLGWRAGFRMIEVAPVAAAARIEVPVMLIHGSADRVVPVGDSLRIQQVLGPQCGQLRIVEGGDHHGVLIHGGEEIYAEIGEFFLNNMW